MQLLIVDDELLAIEAIQYAVPWEQLGIISVFTANHIKKAKEIFGQHKIDILLCDIEMPKGSGLELLEWVREHASNTVTIFMTCHAEFQYAKKAFQLGGLDYILKPIPYDELTAAIRNGIEKIRKDSESLENYQIRLLWNRHQPMIIENFWLDVISQSIPANPQAIQEAAAGRNIALAETMEFVPILIQVKRWNKDFSKRDGKIMEYALRNASEELLLNQDGGAGHLIALHEATLLAIQTFEQASQRETMLQRCQTLIESCCQFFYCDVSCYIGQPSAVHAMAETVESLLAYDRNNVTRLSGAFLVSEQQTPLDNVKVPDMTTWAIMLKEDGSKEKVLKEVDRYLHKLSESRGVDLWNLQRFQQDMLQMIYYVLKLKGIHAHRLFTDPESLSLSSNATRSLADLRAWSEHVIGKAEDSIVGMEKSDSIVQRIKNYIGHHLDHDLTRDSIADMICLNPDYLTRVFKKETGQSIVEYIAQERVKCAKELLAKTEMPVSAIALSVGYNNFSHFSQMFKKHVQMNPGEYRCRFADKEPIR
ncbi:response regulator transcription factor [Paenibacillus periandrae]|uniref:response regulator transcription factor n=1 Tax=Paenibacillus periandrae TaxID=1761741 RepID=UPI001F08B848|nr:response regulator [Paenibacillus periandrae]